jgi:hypothetical protein
MSIEIHLNGKPGAVSTADARQQAEQIALAVEVAELAEMLADAPAGPHDAGEGTRELSGPGRELLATAIAEQDGNGQGDEHPRQLPAAAETELCGCSHPWDRHGYDGDHECLGGGCGCLRYRAAAPNPVPAGPRTVTGKVIGGSVHWPAEVTA